MKKQQKKRALRPDTTLVPADDPEGEVYAWSLPTCCLRAVKEAVIAEVEERRRLELGCSSCGRRWRVTSSLDERILDRFVTHGGSRAGGSYPAA